jgi:hypothetical protein
MWLAHVISPWAAKPRWIWATATMLFTNTTPVFTVGRDFRLTCGSGSDAISWEGEDLSFAGKFTVLSGDGADSVQLMPTKEVFVGRNVNILSSNTDPAAAVKQRIVPVDAMNIGGSVKLTANSGDVVQELVADTGSLTVAGSVGLRLWLWEIVSEFG